MDEEISKPRGLPEENGRENDAAVQFVLESKGKWWHAGYHLTTAIVGPTILALPYTFSGMGWAVGFLCLTVIGLVTFYAYYLMSKVLDHKVAVIFASGNSPPTSSVMERELSVADFYNNLQT